jgi:hypothetical protein
MSDAARSGRGDMMDGWMGPVLNVADVLSRSPQIRRYGLYYDDDVSLKPQS